MPVSVENEKDYDLSQPFHFSNPLLDILPLFGNLIQQVLLNSVRSLYVMKETIMYSLKVK